MAEVATKDWSRKNLGEICSFVYGKNLPEKDRTFGNVPVYGSNGIVGYHNKALVSSPGIVIGRKGSAGLVHFSPEPFFPIDTTFYISQNDTKADLKYLFYLLKNVDLRKLKADVGVPGISREMAYRESVLVPESVEEQNAIAQILNITQEAIAAQEALIAKLKELKRSMMQHLFTHGTKGEKTKMTDIGEMPESWDILKLGLCYDTQLGKMLSQKAHTGADPKQYLRNKNVQWGVIDTNDLLKMDFSAAEREKFRLQKGDLLICEGGEPGRAAIWSGQDVEIYYQKALHRLRPKNSHVSNEWLLYWLEFALRYQDLYGIAGASSTIAHLPETQLKTLEIPVPKKEELEIIVSSINAIDDQIVVSSNRLKSYQDLFSTLLHELMTGERRMGVTADNIKI